MRLWSWILVALLLLAGNAAARDLAVVVSKSNATRNVALADLAKLAKGTTKKWADSKDVVLVIKDPSAPEMKTVLQKVFGMTPDEVKALISTLNAARRDSVLIVPSDDVLVKTVATTPGAIGFVDVYSINSSVSVVKIDTKSPLEPGYALHGQ
jgi:ABC-type phosphate transport system substrate-binding protein